MAKVFTKDFPVVVDKKVKTIEFLEACEKIPGFFDLLGGKVFYPVKQDVVNNIEKIQKRYLEKPGDFEYVMDIIVNEQKETDKKLKAGDGNGIATNALMWLKRGLRLIVLFLEHFLLQDYDANPENLKCCVNVAYENSLKKYHGWMVGKLVKVATNACPYRKDFVKSLCESEGLDEDQMLTRIKEYLVNFKANVDLIYEIFDDTGVEKDDKA